jgi:hypothetical protein
MIRCAKCGGPVRWTRGMSVTEAYCPRVECTTNFFASGSPTFIPCVVKEPLRFDGHGNFDGPSTTEVTR